MFDLGLLLIIIRKVIFLDPLICEATSAETITNSDSWEKILDQKSLFFNIAGFIEDPSYLSGPRSNFGMRIFQVCTTSGN